MGAGVIHMQLLETDDDSMTIKMSKQDFADVMSAFEYIRQDYDSADLSIVQMTKPRVSELLDILTKTMRQIPMVSQQKSRPIHAVS
jgi:hypothetical protein